MTNKCLPAATLLLLTVLLTACGTSKSFRKLAADEKQAIKTARKQYVPGNSRDAYVLLMTDKGNIVLRLYNQTPLHRDNFLAKVQAGFYDSLLFHRVINNFMIQGGDPGSKRADAKTMLGSGDAPGGRIAAEIRTDQGIYHQRGALAAARDNNPEKASSNCQFYIVQRPAWRVGALDSTITQRNLKLNEQQRNLYTTIGGTPHLDGNYTVFGETVAGLPVVDSIATTTTGPADRPVQDIRMRMFVLKAPKK